jgi:uncharacterized protein
VKAKNGIIPLPVLQSVFDLNRAAVFNLDQNQFHRIAESKDKGVPFQGSDLPLMEAGFLDWEWNVVERRHVIETQMSEAFRNTAALSIMPTEKCNFRCTYCYESFLKGKMSPEIQQGVVKYLQFQVPKFQFFNLAWFGGEPLLHPNIVLKISKEFREIALKANVNSTIAITTNGSLLSASTIDELTEVQIDLFHITVDGPKPLHEAMRRSSYKGGTYELILDNIERVLEKTKSNLYFRINIDTRQPERLSEIREWFTTEIFPRFSGYSERIHFHPVSVWDATTSSVDGICISDLSRFQTWLSIKMLAQKAIGAQALESFSESLRTTGDYACYAGRPNHFVLGADGKLYKCTVAFDLPENSVGKITSDGQVEIDNEREAIWIANTALNDPQCKKCDFAQSCMGIHCPLIRIQTQRSPCPSEKVHLSEYIRISMKAQN